MTSTVRLSGAFTEEQTSRLTGLSLAQLRYWDRTRFFQPSLGYEHRRSPYSRIYSFDDVVALQVLSELRNEHQVPLQHLRKIREKLALPQSTWADDEVFVKGRNVYFKNQIGSLRNADTGEDTLPSIPLKKVISKTVRQVHTIMRRDVKNIGTISQKKRGRRIFNYFAGTRIPTSIVAEYENDGYADEDILSDYPTLTYDDLAAARLAAKDSAA